MMCETLDTPIKLVNMFQPNAINSETSKTQNIQNEICAAIKYEISQKSKNFIIFQQINQYAIQLQTTTWNQEYNQNVSDISINILNYIDCNIECILLQSPSIQMQLLSIITSIIKMINLKKCTFSHQHKMSLLNHINLFLTKLSTDTSNETKDIKPSNYYEIYVNLLQNLGDFIPHLIINQYSFDIVLNIAQLASISNLISHTYSTIIHILSHFHVVESISAKSLLYFISHLSYQKAHNIKISSKRKINIISLMINTVLESFVGNQTYVRDVCDDAPFLQGLQLVTEFINHLYESTNSRTIDIFISFLHKYTKDSISLSKTINHPFAMISIISITLFTTRTIPTNDSFKLKCSLLEILTQILCFYHDVNQRQNVPIFEHALFFRFLHLKYKNAQILINSYVSQIFHYSVEATTDLTLVATSCGVEKQIHTKDAKNMKNFITLQLLTKFNIKSTIDYILIFINENSIQMRIKSLKMINLILISHPFLQIPHLQAIIEARLYDNSAQVREVAVNILSVFISTSPSTIYIDALLQRTLDSNLHVRKTVVKILINLLNVSSLASYHNDIIIRLLKRLEDSILVKFIIPSIVEYLTVSETDPDSVSRISSTLICISKHFHEESSLIFHQFLTCVSSRGTQKGENPSNLEFFDGLRKIIDHLFKDYLLAFSHTSIDDHMLSVSISSANLISQLTPIFPTVVQTYSCVLTSIVETHCARVTETPNYSDSHDFIFQQACKILSLFLSSSIPHSIDLVALQDNLLKIIIQHTSSLNEAIRCLKSVLDKREQNYKLVSDLFQHLSDYLCNPTTTISCASSPTTPCSLSLETSCAISSSTSRAVSVNNNIIRILYTLTGIIKHFKLQLIPVDFDYKSLASTLLRISSQSIDLSRLANTTLISLLQQKAKLYLDLQFRSHVLFLLKESDESLRLAILTSILHVLQQSSDSVDANRFSETCSLIRTYFTQIQSCYISINVELRLAVFLIVKQSVKLGAIPPQTYIPLVVVMTLDPDLDLNAKSLSLLKRVSTKYPNFIRSNFKSGVPLAFSFYRTVCASPFNEYICKQNATSFFSPTFLLVTHKSHRVQFIERLFSHLSSSINDDGGLTDGTNCLFILFIAVSLVYLPFKSFGDVRHLLELVDVSLGLLEENSESLETLLLVVVLTRMKEFIMKAFNLEAVERNVTTAPERKSKVFVDFTFFKSFTTTLDTVELARFKKVLVKELHKDVVLKLDKHPTNSK